MGDTPSRGQGLGLQGAVPKDPRRKLIDTIENHCQSQDGTTRFYSALPNPAPLQASPRPPPLTASAISNDKPVVEKPITYRIQLKKIYENISVNKEKIFQICYEKLNAPLIRLTENNSGYSAITDDPHSVDKLTCAKSVEMFRGINLTPVVPPDLRAKRTVFVRQVDECVGSHSEEEIKEEIERSNKGFKIDKVTKIKNFTHIMKITTKDTDAARKILNQGIYIYNTKITSHQCEPEKYCHLLICFKCYAIEDHTTSKCTSKLTVCSECGETGHTFRECENPTKSCLNCGGAHRTLANMCPVKKEKIRRKERMEEERKEAGKSETYAKIVQQTINKTEAFPKMNQMNLNDKTQLKLVAIILEAHIACMGNPEKYGTTLSETLKMNFGIDTTFPNRDSASIFGFYMGNSGTSADNASEAQTQQRDTGTGGIQEKLQQLAPHKTNSSAQANSRDPRLRSNSCSMKGKQTRYERQTHLTLAKQTAENFNKQPEKSKYITALGMEVEVDEVERDRTNKRKADNSPQSSNSGSHNPDEPLEVKLYRSKHDPTPIPLNPSKHWYISEINKETFGIKLLVKHPNPPQLLNQISAGNYSFDYTNILEISNDEFQPMKKITTKDILKIPPAPYTPFTATKKKSRKEPDRRTSQ